MAGARGVDALGAHDSIGPGELQEILEREGLELRRGDVALVRTGYLSGWPDAVAGDTEALEVLPSTVPGNPAPGPHRAAGGARDLIIEMVNGEELARDGRHEFCFVCLPLSIRGATGSMVRAIALC